MACEGVRKRNAGEIGSGHATQVPKKHRAEQGAGTHARSIMKCAYRACSSYEDCRYTRFFLQREKVDLRKCRQGLKENARKIRFCCADHMELCAIHSPLERKSGKQGARAQMSAEQCKAFFNMCISVGKPWLAVLHRLQLETVQRGCVPCAALVGSLRKLSTSGCGASLDVPAHKTTPQHQVPLPQEFAKDMYKWLYITPLKGAHGTQWPWPGQPVHESHASLFPGLQTKGPSRGDRAWYRSVSTRSYNDALKNYVGAACQKEQLAANQSGKASVFDGFDWNLLGTHTFRRTAIVVMTYAGISTNVIASLAGNTSATINKYYDTPSALRERSAINKSVLGHSLLFEGPGAAEASDPLRQWAKQNVEACGHKEASGQHRIKEKVANHLGLAVRDPSLVTKMRGAGFSFGFRMQGNKGLCCKFKFTEHIAYVKMRRERDCW